MAVSSSIYVAFMRALEARHGDRLISSEWGNRVLHKLGDLESEYQSYDRVPARLSHQEEPE